MSLCNRSSLYSTYVCINIQGTVVNCTSFLRLLYFVKVNNVTQSISQVSDVRSIADVLSRTDARKAIPPEVLTALEDDCRRLSEDREAAVEHFARKRVQDLGKLEGDIQDLENKLQRKGILHSNSGAKN